MGKGKQNRMECIRAAFILIVSLIGGYGIITAPEKNTEAGIVLEEELKRNQDYLREQNRVVQEGGQEISQDGTGKSNVRVTVIGDSVVLGAAPSISDVIPDCHVDAEESRQAVSTVEILKTLEEKGKLGDIVVISLGTNGYFYEDTGQEIIDYLGGDRIVYWINIYGKYLQSHYATNEVIADLVEKNENVNLIDWNSEGSNHPDWFYEDGIHLNKTGQQGFAEFIMQNLELSENVSAN